MGGSCTESIDLEEKSEDRGSNLRSHPGGSCPESIGLEYNSEDRGSNLRSQPGGSCPESIGLEDNSEDRGSNLRSQPGGSCPESIGLEENSEDRGSNLRSQPTKPREGLQSTKPTYKDTLKTSLKQLQINPESWEDLAWTRSAWRRTVKTGAAIYEASNLRSQLLSTLLLTPLPSLLA
ncbi:unnamed protein product [Schistocephalus solidus]|uniref:Uncharacterized protein n=1 Tax=Schistocephalus solidus TaxID=70667 RepID=A0A3P7DLY0_SCHSO|nr:unnamed protein product [Schistocephalus solidus]